MRTRSQKTEPLSESATETPLIIDQITFKQLSGVGDGLIFLGCGGDLAEWYNGVMDALEELKIAWRENFAQPRVLYVPDGRIDLVIPFNTVKTERVPDLGRLAMWRLQYGNAKWISDYLVNFARDIY